MVWNVAAPANVTFKGRVSDEVLAHLYARCRATLFASEEDFGLVPVEAQAAGRPVIAFARGGAGESVIDPRESAAWGRPPTGVTFDRQTPESIVAAVERFETLERDFDPRALRRHAERFSAPRFREELMGEVRAALGLAERELPEVPALPASQARAAEASSRG